MTEQQTIELKNNQIEEVRNIHCYRILLYTIFSFSLCLMSCIINRRDLWKYTARHKEKTRMTIKCFVVRHVQERSQRVYTTLGRKCMEGSTGLKNYS
jgi:hypothetical protein